MFVIRPDGREPHEVRSLADAVASKASALGMLVKVRRSREDRVAGAEERERPLWLLTPRDAHEVYAAAHRGPVAVATFRASFVRRDPSTTPARRRDLAGIASYLRYKAFHSLVRGRPDVATFFDEFAVWAGRTECENHTDPRAIPFHVFDVESEWTDLDTAASRQDFDRRHKHLGSRRDDSGRRWDPADPRAYHRPPELRVRGRALPVGFHWDVSHNATRLLTSNEVWKLAGSGAYANVYPDGYIASSPGNAKRVWPV